MILSVSNVSKEFVTGPVLKSVSFHVNEHEHVAIVGVNGAGKSTLLKIIMGEENADEGIVTFSKDTTTGYLAQNPALDSTDSIYNIMMETKKDVIELEHTMHDMEKQMKAASGEALTKLYDDYAKVTHAFEQANGYAVKSQVTGILKGLGFSEEEFDTPVNTLSGGQKTRVYLGRILLAEPDIIFLDEPTNHLDMSSIEWLEGYLRGYKGAVVIVAHDRYFLDRVADKVVEIDMGHAETFIGNYSTYAVKKRAEREARIKAYLNQQREIAHQEAVIEKLKSFNREKSIKRAESREKMLDKVERLEKPVEIDDRMKIELTPHVQSGNDVLTVTGLSKSFDGKHLFDNIDFEIKRGERVAIIGNNGTGKTTILKIINGLLPQDSGEIELGAKVMIGYYDQEHQVLDHSKTLFDELQDTYPYLNNTEIRNVLAAFLFTGDDVFKLIRDLSGGERGRVSLAKLMLSEANFLILDEPTNHLDVTSKEILEEALNTYTGTVLYVSHDRYFINQTATRILDLTDGKLLNYIGNYDYYLEKKQYIEAAAGISAQETGKGIMGVDPATKKDAGENISTGRLSYEEQKAIERERRKKENALKACESEIAKLEARESEIDTLLSDPALGTDLPKLTELTKEKTAIDKKLEKLMEQWEELSE